MPLTKLAHFVVVFERFIRLPSRCPGCGAELARAGALIERALSGRTDRGRLVDGGFAFDMPIAARDGAHVPTAYDCAACLRRLTPAVSVVYDSSPAIAAPAEGATP